MRSASPGLSLGLSLGLLVLCPSSRPALAATPTASFGVSVIVQATCLVSASATTFKTYAIAMAKAASTVSVDCTNSASYNVSIAAEPTDGSTPALSTINRVGTARSDYGLSSNPRTVASRFQTANNEPLIEGEYVYRQALAIHNLLSVFPEHPDAITVNVTY